MAVGTVSVATKAATAWLVPFLKSWIEQRKTAAAEQKAWRDVSNAIIKQTQLLVDRYSKVTTVAFPRDSVPLDSIYVPLTIVRARGKGSITVDSFPNDLFKDGRKALLVDVAGMGKSTVSKVTYLRSLEERKFLPILIDLRRLTDQIGIEESVMVQFGVSAANFESLKEFLRTQTILFILDGFDEISDKNKASVARGVRSFVDRAENGRFLMTSRPELPFGEYSDFLLYKIQELTRAQATQLIKNYGEAYDIEDRARALLDELRARHDDSVTSFLKNPLLTSLLFRAFEFKSVVPVKRGVFYRQVFDALYEAHDLSKETGYVREKRTGLHHDDFHRAVRALAKLFRQKGEVEVSVDEFADMARTISQSLCPDLSFRPEDLLADLLNAVPIFQRDGMKIRWAHKSLLDYFLCEFLLRDYSQSKPNALRNSALGKSGLSNHNLLVLAHEADPILFSQSVTIPAIDVLLERYERMSEVLPSWLSGELRQDLLEIIVCCEFVSDGDSSFAFWMSDDFESTIKEKYGIVGYVPRLIVHNDEKSGFCVMVSDAVIALAVPVMLGAVASKSLHELRVKSELGKSELREVLVGLKGVFSRRSAGEWAGIEEELAAVVASMKGHDYKIFDIERLRADRMEIFNRVQNSMKARSELF
ncbi:hypothetical protein R1V99_05195 [Stenotrophomonas maltophilia]|nr:hypothetical protein [Stenotrophomonas maltophilia]